MKSQQFLLVVGVGLQLAASGICLSTVGASTQHADSAAVNMVVALGIGCLGITLIGVSLITRHCKQVP